MGGGQEVDLWGVPWKVLPCPGSLSCLPSGGSLSPPLHLTIMSCIPPRPQQAWKQLTPRSLRPWTETDPPSIKLFLTYSVTNENVTTMSANTESLVSRGYCFSRCACFKDFFTPSVKVSPETWTYHDSCFSSFIPKGLRYSGVISIRSGSVLLCVFGKSLVVKSLWVLLYENLLS